MTIDTTIILVSIALTAGVVIGYMLPFVLAEIGHRQATRLEDHDPEWAAAVRDRAEGVTYRAAYDAARTAIVRSEVRR